MTKYSEDDIQTIELENHLVDNQIHSLFKKSCVNEDSYLCRRAGGDNSVPVNSNPFDTSTNTCSYIGKMRQINR